MFLKNLHEACKAGIGFCGRENQAKAAVSGGGGGGRRRPWKTPAATIQAAFYRIDAPGPAASESAFVSPSTLPEFTAGDVFRYADF